MESLEIIITCLLGLVLPPKTLAMKLTGENALKKDHGSGTNIIVKDYGQSQMSLMTGVMGQGQIKHLVMLHCHQT